MQAVHFGAPNAAADVHDPLPPPTRFRKNSAPQNVGEEAQRLIWAYTQKYRRQTIEGELSCGSSLPSSPSTYEWNKLLLVRTTTNILSTNNGIVSGSENVSETN